MNKFVIFAVLAVAIIAAAGYFMVSSNVPLTVPDEKTPQDSFIQTVQPQAEGTDAETAHDTPHGTPADETSDADTPSPPPPPPQQPMTITSSAFGNSEQIPAIYTCDGANVNPSLAIAGAPENAATLALIVDDPDAPSGTWVHWVVWNIDPATSAIAEGSVPQGAAQGVTSFGTARYGGPCPPSGTHRYFFKLYALDTTLSLAAGATKASVEQAMAGRILAEAQLIGSYSYR